jgi:phage terminase small subunit
MRGRKPRPNAEKIAKGETRPSRVNYDEPDVPPPANVIAPKDLRGAGFRLWRDHAQAMKDSGQLRATDMPLFRAHCKAAMDIEFWEQEKAKRDLDRAARITIQRTLNQLGSLYLRQAAELGMTSVARSRVKTVTKAPVAKPKHDRFFKGLRGISGGRA